MNKLLKQLFSTPRELKIFIFASFSMGMGYSIFDSIFNNYLKDKYDTTPWQRSFLEFPRELPGFLVVFVTAALWILCSRRLGALSMLLSFIGVLLIGFAAPTYTIMVLFLFVYSMGQHLFMPIAQTIGMELAEEGQTGRRLGQLNSIRNVATIIGSFLVFITFKYLHFEYTQAFVMVALFLGIATMMMYAMKPEENLERRSFLKLKKEYKLYYLLNILSGSRKQLFITFGPWVIVTIFKQPTQTLATLLTIGGIIGVFFQPILGKLIDRKGERFVLATESVLLVFVSLGYGFSKFILPEYSAFIAICVFYLLDQMLFSVGMARSMYMRKIALFPGDVQPTLAAGVTIDHIFSILIALLGGFIWNQFGFQYVFLMGVVIATINFFVALQVKIQEKSYS